MASCQKTVCRTRPHNRPIRKTGNHGKQVLHQELQQVTARMTETSILEMEDVEIRNAEITAFEIKEEDGTETVDLDVTVYFEGGGLAQTTLRDWKIESLAEKEVISQDFMEKVRSKW